MPPAPLLEMRGIDKRFGASVALDQCDLSVEAGSVHGLVGQNGAGKSTLIKILAGLETADRGEIQLAGERLAHATPQLMARRGVAFIHQDRLLVPNATVAEALFLGREPRIPVLGLVDRRRLRAAAREALAAHFDLDLPPDRLVNDLTAGEQKILQITRALLDQPKLLVLDEPTAALVAHDVSSLERIVRRLRDSGTAILYVSHYLDEIERLCDRVTVLRQGRSVARLVPRESGLGPIVSLMVGRDLADIYPARNSRPPGASLLEARGLGLSGQYEDISFDLHEGEILGITGVLGCGGKALLRGLFGERPPERGEIRLGGEKRMFSSPRAAIRAGLGFVPEDRSRESVITRLSIAENVTLASLSEFRRHLLADHDAQDAAASLLIAALGIATSGPAQPVGELSGGNQQKVALGKWLRRDVRVLLLDEPTVGVDIAAKSEIYALLAQAAARGQGVIVFSSDLEELLGLADRILVLHRGRLAGGFDASRVDAATLLSRATGADATPR